MSRVIKRAILQDANPKVLENPSIDLARQLTGDDVMSEADRKVAEACAALIATQQQKAEACLQDAQSQRNIMLADAQGKCDAMLAEAKEEAERLKIAAKEEGHRLGLEEGRLAGIAQIEQEMASRIEEANAKAERVLEMAKQEQKETVMKSERQILEIALAVAEKVVHAKLSEDASFIIEIIKNALEKVKNQRKITIKVAMDDYEFVMQSKLVFENMLDSDFELTLLADRLIEKGGCVIESESGTVDARLKTQLDGLKKAVQDVI